MKRFFTYLSALLVAAACAPQLEIEYDHEKQAFETRSDRILVEVILPQATAAGNEVYIIGAFNGESAAIGNKLYKLTRSENNTMKWGIYLDPSTFQGGKTLADGFTFYNVQQGFERSSKNEAVTHTLTIGTGEWANVYADKWEAYFDPDSWSGGDDDGGIVLPDLDGYGFFVDNSEAPSYAQLALYAWGDAEAFGAWPGMQPTGTWEYGGVVYTYFDLGSANTGLTENFIINNNNGGSQLETFPVLQGQVIDHNFFFKITDSDVIPVTIGDPRDGMKQASEWGITGSIASTGNNWGNDGDADIAMVTDGTWHAALGIALTTSDQFKFRLNGGWDSNFGGSLGDKIGEPVEAVAGGDNLVVSEDGTYDLFLNPEAAQIVVVHAGDPVTLPSGSGDVIEEEDGPKIYIRNDIFSDWGTTILAQYWGDGPTKKDPGSSFERVSVTIEGSEYPETFWMASTRHSKRGQSIELMVFPQEDAVIFYESDESKYPKDKDGNPRLEPRKATTSVVMDTDRYFILKYNEAGDPVLEEIDMGVHLFVDNKTFWPGELYVHAWVDATDTEAGISTEWPGVTSVPGYDSEQNEYSTFFLPKAFRGKTAEVIFHSDVDDSNNRLQAPITFAGDQYYVLSREIYLDPVEKDPVTLYVIDQTGWEDLAVYLWGDVNNLGGGWPGITASRTETVGKTTMKVFEIPNAMTRNENLIFNNNNGGIQLGDFNITFTQPEYYLLVTAEGVEITERPKAATPKVTFFVNDQTGWDGLALYQWGDVNNLGGGWPGAPVSGTVNIAGTAYKVFVVEDAAGLNQNLIFNNNGGGVQLGDYALTLNDAQYFLTVTSEGVTLGEAPNAAVVFVDDQTGWDGLALYQWGAVNNLGGGWPGAQVSTTATVCGKECKVFVVEGAAGLSQNLIFNNNGGGVQLGDYALTFEKVPYFLTVTAEGVSEF